MTETPEEQVERILAEREGKPLKQAASRTADAPMNAPKDTRFANLKPAWQPGESGNPSGKRPGTMSLRTILKNRLAETPDPSDRRTLAEQLVDSTCKAALRGDSQARKLIWESIEGAPRQRIQVEDDDPLLEILAMMRGEAPSDERQEP